MAPVVSRTQDRDAVGGGDNFVSGHGPVSSLAAMALGCAHKSHTHSLWCASQPPTENRLWAGPTIRWPGLGVLLYSMLRYTNVKKNSGRPVGPGAPLLTLLAVRYCSLQLHAHALMYTLAAVTHNHYACHPLAPQSSDPLCTDAGLTIQTRHRTTGLESRTRGARGVEAHGT